MGTISKGLEKILEKNGLEKTENNNFFVKDEVEYKIVTLDNSKRDRSFANPKEIDTARKSLQKNQILTYGHFCEDSKHFKIEEVHSLPNLHQELEQGPFTYQNTLEAVSELAQNLYNLHELGFFHSYINSKSIFYESEKNRLKLGYLENIKNKRQKHQEPKTGKSKWLPIEVYGGNWSSSADVFSLGVLIQVLHPQAFEGKEEDIDEDYKKLRSIVSQAKHPDAKYQLSASELSQDLESLLRKREIKHTTRKDKLELEERTRMHNLNSDLSERLAIGGKGAASAFSWLANKFYQGVKPILNGTVNGLLSPLNIASAYRRTNYYSQNLEDLNPECQYNDIKSRAHTGFSIAGGLLSFVGTGILLSSQSWLIYAGAGTAAVLSNIGSIGYETALKKFKQESSQEKIKEEKLELLEIK